MLSDSSDDEMCLQIDGVQQGSPDESEFLQIDVELAGGAFQDFASDLSPPGAHVRYYVCKLECP